MPESAQKILVRACNGDLWLISKEIIENLHGIIKRALWCVFNCLIMPQDLEVVGTIRDHITASRVTRRFSDVPNWDADTFEDDVE